MRSTERYIYLTVVLLALIFIILFPVNKTGINLCIMNKCFNIPCPLCGMLRSLHYTGIGDIKKALYFNPFGVLLFIIIVLLVPVLLINKFYDKVSGIINSKNKIKRIIYIIIGLLFFLFTILRIIRIDFSIFYS